MQGRFENGIYRDCKWCKGKGCLACPGEAEKDFNRFVDKGGLEPIFTANINNPDEMDQLKNIFNFKSLQHAFGPEGSGILEIRSKIDHQFCGLWDVTE